MLNFVRYSYDIMYATFMTLSHARENTALLKYLKI